MKKTIILMLITLLVTVSAGGCFAEKPDPGAQETAIAIAVTAQVAAMTTQAYLNPSPTVTQTPTATQTNTPEPTATFLPTNTFTPEPTVAKLAAKLLSIGTFPERKTAFTPNERFSLAVSFENTGNVPWYPGTTLKLTGIDGAYVTVQTEAKTDRQVNPGERIEFALWAYGSEDMSFQRFYFQMYSDYGGVINGGSAVFGYQPY